MTRRRIVRWQIALLVLIALLLIGRKFIGDPAPEGLIVFTDLSVGELKHAAFVLDEPAALRLDATGSFERDAMPSPLAAYAWILRRDTRAVVWQMEPTTVQRGNGTLALATDSLVFEAGTYDVFFTTYGPTASARSGSSFLGLRRHWRNDADFWQFILRPADAANITAIRPLFDEKSDELVPRDLGEVWSTTPAGNDQHRVHFFEVVQPTDVQIYAIGELCEQPCDYGWIENLGTGSRVWEMTWENTEPAGGWSINRVFRGAVRLAPGVYRTAFTTDRGHAYGDWTANPPFDPTGWGMTLTTATSDALIDFEPFGTRTPLLSLVGVPNETLVSRQFVVHKPMRVLTYGLGEIGWVRKDYGWIENTTVEKTVWEMTRETSEEVPPPGSDNRVEIAFLDLDPGTYTAYFQTDESHAFDDWSNGAPDHPDRWGLTLFAPLGAALDTAAFALLDTAPSSPVAETPPDAPLAPPAPGAGTLLFERTRLGNGQEILERFALDAPARIHITAVGEITSYDRYDYGKIKRDDTGETVWEMTLQNTEPAGGSGSNRRFDGVLALPAGDYLVYFQTDASHAFGDFGDNEAPPIPDAWGILLRRLDD